MDEKEIEKAKEVATKHYQLLMENKKDEWLKTIESSIRDQSEQYGSSPYFWWTTGRKMAEGGFSYKFKNFDKRSSSETRIKLFFHRFDKNGKPSGSGQVPIILVRDPGDNDEWRVDVSSW